MESVHFFHSYKPLNFPEKLMRSTAEKIYRNEKVPQKRVVDCILCSDYMIRKLNAKYRKIDKSTDVLSFPFDEPDYLGEIYISLQRASVQARKYGGTYDEEILRLFVHGMFHLLGYDHETRTQEEKMKSKEKRYVDL